MDRYDEILEKLNGLGISVRKMIKEQRSLLEVQSQIAVKHDELKAGNEELKLKQEELMRVMLSMNGRMGGLSAEAEDAWITKAEVMGILCITESTFYRRLEECNWLRKKNGRGWYYLKSSLFELCHDS